MSVEKKRSLTFKWIEKDLQDLYDFIGFGDKAGEYFCVSMEDKLRKLILDKSLPTPLSPSGEQSPTVETETALETQSPLVFAQEHPCPYRTLVNVKGNAAESHILCSETDKLPLVACITRQKRYLHFERSCRPLKQDKEKPAKPQRQQPTTRPFKGNDFVQEGVLPRFFCPDGHPPSWCHGGNSCNRRLTCPEMNRQPSR